VFGGLVALAVAGVLALNTFHVGKELVWVNLVSRGNSFEERQGLKAELRAGHFRRVRDLLDRRAGAAEGRLGKGDRIIGALRSLGQWPSEEKRKTALYIPKSNRAYWDLLKYRGSLGPNHPLTALRAALLAPAVTGMAMIDGLPEYAPGLKGYSIEVYTLREPPDKQPDLEAYREELCRRARAWGLSRVVVLDADRDGDVSQVTLSCQ
jgi:hypothetical protein